MKKKGQLNDAVRAAAMRAEQAQEADDYDSPTSPNSGDGAEEAQENDDGELQVSFILERNVCLSQCHSYLNQTYDPAFSLLTNTDRSRTIAGSL